MTLQIFEGRYQHMTSGVDGPVGRWLGRTAKTIESQAKVIVTEERLIRTGRYRQSIHGFVIHDGAGLVGKVGSLLPVARLIEHGTPSHEIPLVRNRMLWWDMPNDRGWMANPESIGPDGQFHVHPVPAVNHPGTRAYMVLHRAMLRVLKGGIR